MNLSKFFIKTKNINFFNRTYVMGVLNITPDSFSDGSDFLDKEKALKRALEIEKEGADIIDIGAKSTKPGHVAIDEKEEWGRLKNPLKLIKENLKIPISIDTSNSYVAKNVIEMGVDVINDVSGFTKKEMIDVVKNSDVSLVIMHDGALNQTKKFLQKKHKELSEVIESERICLDPGVGFSKTNDENLYILKNSKEFSINNSFVLIGASRKRVTKNSYREKTSPKERLFATIAAHSISVFCGANMIRVHDVKAAVESCRMVDLIV